jgi:hypothetical protein
MSRLPGPGSPSPRVAESTDVLRTPKISEPPLDSGEACTLTLLEVKGPRRPHVVSACQAVDGARHRAALFVMAAPSSRDVVSGRRVE